MTDLFDSILDLSHMLFFLVSLNSLGQWWITLPTGDQKMAFEQDIGQGGLMHKISYPYFG